MNKYLFLCLSVCIRTIYKLICYYDHPAHCWFFVFLHFFHPCHPSHVINSKTDSFPMRILQKFHVPQECHRSQPLFCGIHRLKNPIPLQSQFPSRSPLNTLYKSADVAQSLLDYVQTDIYRWIA